MLFWYLEEGNKTANVESQHVKIFVLLQDAFVGFLIYIPYTSTVMMKLNSERDTIQSGLRNFVNKVGIGTKTEINI